MDHGDQNDFPRFWHRQTLCLEGEGWFRTSGDRRPRDKRCHRCVEGSGPHGRQPCAKDPQRRTGRAVPDEEGRHRVLPHRPLDRHRRLRMVEHPRRDQRRRAQRRRGHLRPRGPRPARDLHRLRDPPVPPRRRQPRQQPDPHRHHPPAALGRGTRPHRRRQPDVRQLARGDGQRRRGARLRRLLTARRRDDRLRRRAAARPPRTLLPPRHHRDPRPGDPTATDRALPAPHRRCAPRPGGR